MTNTEIFKIVYIEDDKTFQKLVSFLVLREPGWECDVFSDRASAISSLKHIQPNLILLDYFLKNDSGETTIKDIAEIGNIPIILVTAHELAEPLVSPIIGLIKKPFQPNLLIQEIKLILSRQ